MTRGQGAGDKHQHVEVWQSRKVGKISLDYARVVNQHSGIVLSLDTLCQMFKYLVC